MKSTSSPLFSAYADQWCDTILPMKKPATIATRSSHVRMLNAALGDCHLDKLDHKRVQAVFTSQARSKAPATVKNLWLTLHSVLSQAQAEGLISVIPKPVLPRQGKVAQEWLTGGQMRSLVALPGAYQAFFSMLCETGMRIGEAVALRESDVCLKNLTITVRRSVYNGREQAPKTDNSQRVVAISGWLRDLLAPAVAEAAGGLYIFRTRAGTPWWPAEISTSFVRSLAEIGLPPAGFHALRRGNITLCAMVLGIPEAIIAQRVGHASEGMTLGVYNQRVDGADRVWVEKIAEALMS